MPFQISKYKLNTSLEAKLNNRAVSLRNVRERAVFRIHVPRLEARCRLRTGLGREKVNAVTKNLYFCRKLSIEMKAPVAYTDNNKPEDTV